MKTLKTIYTAVAATLMTAAPAFASVARVDNSGILVWAFLGLCALIVVAQVIPAAIMLFEMVKGLVTTPTETEVHA